MTHPPKKQRSLHLNIDKTTKPQKIYLLGFISIQSSVAFDQTND